jgi:protein-S-isoprenylcysteine O-methyltransferase Ste14
MIAGLIPWWLTRWQTTSLSSPPLRAVGALLVACGVAVLVSAFLRFVLEGAGTPAPIAPTERLVVGGLYRYVRNPMYLAVLSAIIGQALILGRPGLLLYASAVGLAMASFVRWYEEPALARRFGDEYHEYRRAVRAWWPRWHPWNPQKPGR